MKKVLFFAFALLTLCSKAQTYPFLDDFESYADLSVLGTQGGFNSDMTVYSSHGVNLSQAVVANMNNSNTEDSVLSPFIGALTPYSVFTFQYRVVDIASYPSTPTTLGVGDKIEIMGSSEQSGIFQTMHTIDLSNHITSTNFTKMYFSLGAAAGTNGYLMIKVTRATGDYFVDIDSFSVTDVVAALIIKPTVNNPICNGTGTGSISLVVEGGVQPYTYAWSNSLPPTASQNVPAGTYSVTVTDNSGKVATSTIIVTEPEPVTAWATVTNATCYGSNNGSIDVTVQSGVAPFSFVWSNLAQTEDVSGLAAGTYVVNITDFNGCTASIMQTVLDPAVISVSETHTNVTAPGGNDGTITWVASGGITNYQYSINGGTYTSSGVYISLTANCYTVRVKDANNCLYDSAPVCLTEEITSGISDLQNVIISIYPNPAFDFITVKMQDLTTGEISLISAIGEVIIKRNLTAAEERFDVSTVAQGNYVLTLKTDNGSIRKNISIVK